MTQPYDGTTCPEGSDEKEWLQFVMDCLRYRDSYTRIAREICAAQDAAVEREREAKVIAACVFRETLEELIEAYQAEIGEKRARKYTEYSSLGHAIGALKSYPMFGVISGEIRARSKAQKQEG